MWRSYGSYVQQATKHWSLYTEGHEVAGILAQNASSIVSQKAPETINGMTPPFLHSVIWLFT